MGPVDYRLASVRIGQGEGNEGAYVSAEGEGCERIGGVAGISCPEQWVGDLAEKGYHEEVLLQSPGGLEVLGIEYG